jgi:hypothetical protein
MLEYANEIAASLGALGFCVGAIALLWAHIEDAAS